MIRYRKANNVLKWLGVFVFLLLFLYLGLWDLFLGYFFAPIQNAIYGMAGEVNRLIIRNREIGDLSLKNKDLEEKIVSLQIKNADKQILEEENELLRSKLNFFEIKLKDRKFVLARITGRGLDNNSLIFIDKGRKDGLKEGLPVIAGEGVLIGKIFEADEYTASALLASDTRSLIAGTVLNQTKTSNVVAGKFGLSLNIELIPRNETVRVGDLVVSSGLEDNIPRGLPVGEIEEVYLSPHELFQSALVKPLIPYDKLLIVSVLLPKTN